MSMNSSLDNGDNLFSDPEMSLLRPILFWYFLLCDISSVIFSLCLIIHILINRTQRHALYSHTILVLLIFNLPTQLIDVSLIIVFFRRNFVQPSTPVVCLLWWFVNYGFYAGQIILFAWFAIERSILIFHDRWVANRRGRFLFHYLPLIIIVMYVLLFYIIIIFFLPCENIYDYSSLVCGAGPCYKSYEILYMWEFIMNYSIPIILESIVSTGTFVRVLWQKRRLRQSIQWRRQRRMIVQLVLVSGLNISINLPYYILSIAHLCGLYSKSIGQAALLLYFLSYLLTFFFPFASLCQYPALRQQIKRIVCGIITRQPQHVAIVAPERGPARVIR